MQPPPHSVDRPGQPGPAARGPHQPAAGAPGAGTRAHEAFAGGVGAEAILDERVVENLRRLDGGKGEFLRTLVETYASGWSADLTTLRGALAAGDAEAVRLCAHRLKSASANLGACTLAAKCHSVEAAARDGRLEGVPAVLGDLEHGHERALQALHAARGQAARGAPP